MLHSPDLDPVLAMQDTILKTLISVARGKGTESQVRWWLFIMLSCVVYLMPGSVCFGLVVCIYRRWRNVFLSWRVAAE